MAEVDIASKVSELYLKVLDTLLAKELTPESIGEAAAGLKLLSELLNREKYDTTLLINAIEEVKVKAIAELSAWMKEEIQKLTVQLSSRINEKLSNIPDTENIMRKLTYQNIFGGELR
jgi:hypothetical protein